MTDATKLAASIAAGKTTAQAVMQAALERARDVSNLGSIVRLEAELGLALARQADEKRQRDVPEHFLGLFHGIPFLAKDLGGYGAGLAPSAGNAALRVRSPDPDHSDHLFQAFEATGLLSFGLTTAPEFGLALTSEPPNQPPARNPFDETLSPGGSSGGAAAAVASGIVAMAHATDAAGSTRVPAACCGLVGLKASRARVTGAPHFNNHLMGIASEQAVTRSVRDAQTLFNAVKLDHQDVWPIKRLGICMPEVASDATRFKTDTLMTALCEAGFDAFLISDLDSLGAQAQALTLPIFAASLASWLDGVGLGDDAITPINAAVAAHGRAMAAPKLFDTSVEMLRLGHETNVLFQTVDAIIMPVLADGPPKLGHFDPEQTDVEARLEQMNAVAPNVALANVTGLPALAMPFGMLPPPREHVPFGFQIMGPMGSDESLFDLAAQIEMLAPPIVYPYPIAGMT